MRTNKKIFSLISGLLIAIALVSWNSAENTVLVNAPPSDEQIFRDIVFFEGAKMQVEVSEYIRFKRIAEERGQIDGKSFDDFKTFTVNFIKQKDPTYFKKFVNTIKRDNPYEIRNLLTSSLTVTSISQIIYASDSAHQKMYSSAVLSTDLTTLSSIQQDMKKVLDLYRINNPKYDSTALTAAPIIYQPGLPDIVFAYYPPCSIVLYCAVVLYMDAKTSTDDSLLLTEKISNAIIKNY